MAIDHALLQHLADLSDPIVDINFGASQTERGLATHRDEVLPLATMCTVILDIPHLVGIAAVEHLVDETIIVASIVARVGVLEAIPVINKDLFEDVGVLSRCCHHQIAPSKGVGFWGVEHFYHVSRSVSTPSSVFTAAPSHDLSRPGDTGISEQIENEFSYTIKQKRADLRQLSLALVVDEEQGLPLYSRC
jgi:hypothetical protein